MKKLQLQNWDNYEMKLMLLLGFVCCLISLRNIGQVYSPFLYYEEMGYWTNAATFAGYDWGPVIRASGAPWYAYGYSLTLVPLFWIFNDMVSMYRAAIALNAVWATASFVLCYLIAKRYLPDYNRLTLLAASFVVALYPAFIHQSSINVTETFLYFLVWLVFFLFVLYEDNPSTLRGILLSCALGYMYITHKRTLGIVVAFLLVALFMRILKKISYKDLFALIAPLAIIFLIDKQVTRYLATEIWHNAEISNRDYSVGLSRIANVLANPRELVKSFIGKYWYFCTATFMLAPFGFFFAAERIYGCIKSKQLNASKTVFATAFFALAFAGVFLIDVIQMSYRGGAIGIDWTF